MATSRKIYIETSCFVEVAKHAIGSSDPRRDADIWHLKNLLQAGKDGEVQILTATLTIAECQHAGEPSSDGIPGDATKTLFKNFLMSGQYLSLIQDTVLVAERARNLRWVHRICLSGPDAIHAASALELSCDEFLSFDKQFHKKKKELEEIALSVRLPRNTLCLPDKYRQEKLELNIARSDDEAPTPS